MRFKDKLLCFLGFHEWEKQGGPQNYGQGNFMQRGICIKCRKIKKVVR